MKKLTFALAVLFILTQPASAELIQGWPDLIVCTLTGMAKDKVTGQPAGKGGAVRAVSLLYIGAAPGQDGRYYYGKLAFNADGTASKNPGSSIYDDNCANKSIADLMANGQAFDLNLIPLRRMISGPTNKLK